MFGTSLFATYSIVVDVLTAPHGVSNQKSSHISHITLTEHPKYLAKFARPIYTFDSMLLICKIKIFETKLYLEVLYPETKPIKL